MGEEKKNVWVYSLVCLSFWSEESSPTFIWVLYFVPDVACKHDIWEQTWIQLRFQIKELKIFWYPSRICPQQTFCKQRRFKMVRYEIHKEQILIGHLRYKAIYILLCTWCNSIPNNEKREILQIPIPLLQKFTMWRLTENQDHQKKQICYYSLNYPISFYGQ